MTPLAAAFVGGLPQPSSSKRQRSERSPSSWPGARRLSRRRRGAGPPPRPPRLSPNPREPLAPQLARLRVADVSLAAARLAGDHAALARFDRLRPP
jgi:hypothetical protein